MPSAAICCLGTPSDSPSESSWLPLVQVAIADGLAANATLTYLELSHNPLGRLGVATLLARGTRADRTLRLESASPQTEVIPERSLLLDDAQPGGNYQALLSRPCVADCFGVLRSAWIASECLRALLIASECFRAGWSASEWIGTLLIASECFRVGWSAFEWIGTLLIASGCFPALWSAPEKPLLQRSAQVRPPSTAFHRLLSSCRYDRWLANRCIAIGKEPAPPPGKSRGDVRYSRSLVDPSLDGEPLDESPLPKPAQVNAWLRRPPPSMAFHSLPSPSTALHRLRQPCTTFDWTRI